MRRSERKRKAVIRNFSVLVNLYYKFNTKDKLTNHFRVNLRSGKLTVLSSV